MVEISQYGYFPQKLSLFFNFSGSLVALFALIHLFQLFPLVNRVCQSRGKPSFGPTASGKVPQNYLSIWAISRFFPTFSFFEFHFYALRATQNHHELLYYTRFMRRNLSPFCLSFLESLTKAMSLYSSAICGALLKSLPVHCHICGTKHNKHPPKCSPIFHAVARGQDP